MTIRHAIDDDRATLRALWEEWQAEITAPPWADTSWESNEHEFDRALAANALFLAEENGEAVGFVSSWLEDHVAKIGDLYVTRAARGGGAGAELVGAVIENLRARGATHLLLDANLDALAFYERLGFRERSRNLVLELDVREVGAGRSFGSIHVQTDDLAGVERAVQQFVPRLPGRSRGSEVSQPRGGWIAVYDDVCDRDPAMLRRLAKELSERTGAVVLALGIEHEEVVRFVLLEAGRVVDEYLSVPEYYGALPPGDVVALAANPRVVARLTGADPTVIRSVAKTAASPAELPPAHELLEGIVAAIGLEGADHGWEGVSVITLYDAARCPYCARVRIVLAEKDVPYEAVEIDLQDRPAWLYEKNPVGKVPVLEEDGWVLPESAVISEFLNERYPEPPLWPDDPGERAAGRLLVFRFDDFSKPYYALRRGEDGARERFEEELGFLDRLLEGPPWLSGRAFGLADVAFLPWVLRARDSLGISLEPWPALAAWLERASERPSVAAELELLASL